MNRTGGKAAFYRITWLTLLLSVRFGDRQLVVGDTNDASDVFVRDLATSTITRVSVASSGVQGTGGSGSFMPSISADGRYVAFASSATNLVGGDTNKALSWHNAKPN